MIKKISSGIALTIRVLKNALLRPFRVIYSKVNYMFSAGRVATAIPGAVKKLPKIAKRKPEKREDYFDWGSIYVALSVKGFDEVLSDAITVSIDDRFTVKIASLHGLFLLKFNAWMDRHLTTNKDAEDMSFILDNYFMANLNRETYMEVYDWEDFDEYVAGGYWLSNDLAKLLNREQLAYYADKIDEELQLEERSYLISQILNSQSSLNYDQVRRTWQVISEVFRSAAEERDL